MRAEPIEPERLPYVHVTIPSHRETASGLTVLCEGPFALEMDDDAKVYCADCHNRVVKL